MNINKESKAAVQDISDNRLNQLVGEIASRYTGASEIKKEDRLDTNEKLTLIRDDTPSSMKTEQIFYRSGKKTIRELIQKTKLNEGSLEGEKSFRPVIDPSFVCAL